MSFFEDLPEPPPPPPPAPRPPWLGAPADEVGVSAGTRAFSTHEGRIAFAVIDVIAYSTGFEVIAVTRLRPAERRPARPTHDWHGIRFGVQFSDGRKASAGAGHALLAAAGGTPAGPVIMPGGGGGGAEGWRQFYWVWPLPPPGRLVFAAMWKAAGMPETRLEVDAQPVIDAAKRSQRIW